MLRTLLLACALLICAPALADTEPWDIEPAGTDCTRYEMCRTFTGTGACTNGSEEVVLANVGLACVSLSIEGSTGSAAANVETSRRGHDDASGVGIDLFPSEVTPTTLGAYCGPLDFLWVDVSANPSSDVDAWLTVCKQR
jgi:hypothetical protein